MKRRSFVYGLISVVAVLLLVSIAGLYWITAQSPLKLLTSGPGKEPSASIFVSREAPAMVSLLVNPNDLEAFRRVVAAPGQRRQAQAELTRLKQSLLAGTGLEYDRDVKPWLGDEVTLAITTLDIDRDRSNGQQPGYLVAIATQDPEQSREFLQLFWQKRAIAGSDLMFEQFKGVKLIYGEMPITANPPKAKTKAGSDIPSLASLLPTPTLASAVVGNQFVLFANDVRVLRDAITNVQAEELNLNHASFYQKTLETLTEPRIALSFVNLPSLAGWLETETTAPRPKTAPGKANSESKSLALMNEAVPGQIQTLAIALGLDRHGLMAETAITGAQPQTMSMPALLTEPVGALQYIPASSPLAAAGTHLDQLWPQLTQSLTGYDAVAKLVTQPLQDLQTRWKLDLDKDVFRWVEGDYALGLLPKAPAESTGKAKKAKKKAGAATDVLLANDWVFVAQRPKTEAAQPAIAHLDDVAKRQGYTVGSLNLDGQVVSAWTKLTANATPGNVLQAQVQGVHATVDNYEIFATSVAAMEQALKAINAALTDNRQFQTAIAPLMQPNNGYLYLDWAESRPLLEQQIPFLKVLELAGGPLFSHLRSLTVSSYGTESGVQRGAVFIQLS